MRVRRPDRVNFRVESFPLTDDLVGGTDVVARFTYRWEAGEIDLRDVYQRLDNETLAEISSIATQLKFSGQAR